MRLAGQAIKPIAAELGISPATVLRWTTDITLEPAQRATLNASHHEAYLRRSIAWSERCRQRRSRWQQEGRERARLGDPLHVAGCMLYWAEGGKSKNQLKLCNSEVSMVRFFRRFVSTCFDAPPERFVMSLNVYTTNGLTIAEIEDYWLAALGLHHECMRKHILNHLPTSSSGQKKNRLPYGVCTLGVKRSTPIVQHIFGAIQEYGDFEEPRWLG
jgi:hypothetical protein